jgi:hypothetical protein
MSLERIKQLHRICERSLFMIDSTLNHDRTLQAVTKLADLIHAYDGDTESIWYADGMSNAYIPDLLAGSYWYTVDYQSADQHHLMSMQSAIGSVFSPGCTSLEPDTAESDVYDAWERLRKED